MCVTRFLDPDRNFFRREWINICDYQWDLSDAIVVCRQLGLPTQSKIKYVITCGIIIYIMLQNIDGYTYLALLCYLTYTVPYPRNKGTTMKYQPTPTLGSISC